MSAPADEPGRAEKQADLTARGEKISAAHCAANILTFGQGVRPIRLLQQAHP
jgi:hypothetical protein